MILASTRYDFDYNINKIDAKFTYI